MRQLETMRIAILGFGREGQSVLNFLKNSSAYKGAEIWILDKSLNIKAPAGIKKHLGRGYLKKLDRFDLVFRSPGVPYNLPALKKAKKKKVLTAFFMFKAFDIEGEGVDIVHVMPETKKQIERYLAAEKRRQMRLKNSNKIPFFNN